MDLAHASDSERHLCGTPSKARRPTFQRWRRGARVVGVPACYTRGMFRRASLLVTLFLAPLACGEEAAPGSELWQTRMSAYAYQLAVADDGSVYVAGHADGVSLHKFASDGTPLWTQEDDPELWANDVTVGEDGGIYVVASDWFGSSKKRAIYRYDANGTLVWRLDEFSQPVTTVVPAPGGGVFVGGGSPARFMRVDGDGEIVWSVDEPTLTGHGVWGLAAHGEGFVATGLGETWWVHARDGAGEAVWTANLGPAPAPGPRLPITVDEAGQVFVASMTQNDPAGRGYVATLTNDGEVLEVRAVATPVTGLASIGDDVVVSNLVPPETVQLQRTDGEVVWTAPEAGDCWKTWEVVTGPNAIVALRECGENSAQVVALQP
jgi:hypothetical protein